MHTIEVPCLCDDIEQCLMERYVSDVRILELELAELKAELIRRGDGERWPTP